MTLHPVQDAVSDRAVGNFSAGPSCLSDWVMRTAAEEFYNKNRTGMGIIEVSPTFVHFHFEPQGVLPHSLLLIILLGALYPTVFGCR